MQQITPLSSKSGTNIILYFCVLIIVHPIYEQGNAILWIVDLKWTVE